jgi:protein-ribulosamine 3-kinase
LEKLKIESLLNIKILEYNKTVKSGISYVHFKDHLNKKCFLKSATSPSNQFLCEQNSLKEISKAQDTKMPKLFFANEFCIVMEALNLSYESLSLDRFAKSLHSIHQIKNKDFGFYEDNYLGLSSQRNSQAHNKWSDFFWIERLRFKFDQLNEKEDLSEDFKKMFFKMEAINYDLLDHIKIQPQLVHGDLWSGNIMSLKGGAVGFIDPAVYYGHFEVDLAMTQLFGGVGADIYDYYEKYSHLQEGWEKRQNIYNLYHLLNHAVIFSGSYLNQCLYQMRGLSS